MQCIQETSNEKGSEFIPDSVELLEYELHKIDIMRAESYISPDWIASKKATINRKNEKDNKCFQWSIIAGLNHNIIKEKELKKYYILQGLIQIFHHTKDNGKFLNKKAIQ